MKVPSLILSLIILFQSLNFEITDINKVSNFINDINILSRHYDAIQTHLPLENKMKLQKDFINSLKIFLKQYIRL